MLLDVLNNREEFLKIPLLLGRTLDRVHRTGDTDHFSVQIEQRNFGRNIPIWKAAEMKDQPYLTADRTSSGHHAAILGNIRFRHGWRIEVTIVQAKHLSLRADTVVCDAG